MQVRTRFAPSPTGFLHLGTLRTGLYTYMLAKKNKGIFMLRIEDTDQEREVPGAVEAIYRALKTAGLHWDEGPDVGGEYGPYIQSQRKALYRPYAEQLVESGHAYYCFCTKERLDSERAAWESRGETCKYDKYCLHNVTPDEARARVQAGESHVIRQNVPTEGVCGFDDALYGRIEVECSTLDDNVLIKADGLPTYNFANVVDDHVMQITHVMRGTEYLSSAPKYGLLYDAFGWTPPVYLHVTPIMKDATRKLSKRRGDPSYEDLLDMGFLSEAIVNCVALIGWNPGTNQEFFSLSELVEAFDIRGLSKSPAILDMEKLTWFNAEYVRRMTPEDYKAAALPWLYKVLPEGRFDMDLTCRLLQPRTERFDTIAAKLDFLLAMPEFSPELYVNKKSKTDLDIARAALKEAYAALSALEGYSESAVHDCLMALPPKLNMKNGQVLWPVRIAIAGKESTPAGAIEIAVLLGKEETLSRMRRSMDALGMA